MRSHPVAPWIAGCLLAAGCTGPTAPTPAAGTPGPDPVTPVAAGPIAFRDVTAGSGVDFVHDGGTDDRKRFPTSLGSGVAMIDYDRDGDLDLFFPTTRRLPRSAPSPSRGDRMYRNDGDWHFTDVTDALGVGRDGFTHGAAVGDVNGDGWPDLFLTGLGADALLINEEGRRFRDATAGSGLECHRWCSGAAFLDYDGDGKLDVYVTRYGDYDESVPEPFWGDKARRIRIVGSPFSMAPAPHSLFKGRGDGTFVETTAAAKVARRDGRGLGVVAADVDLDGKTDLYVANDGCPNFLFLNNGDGKFLDASERSGAATDESGSVQGSMGVDVQDVDGDGFPELFVTNFRGQSNTLYRNVGGRAFQDVAAAAGIVAGSRPYVGWGCALADFDGDGLVDMFVVNGEVDDNLRAFHQDIDYEQPTKVWRGRGGFKFEELAGATCGPFFTARHPARGAAFGDLDGDGDLDVVVVRIDKPAVLLSNESPGRGHWVRLVLRPTRSNPSAIGARVVVRAGGRAFARQVRGGDSYLSANDPRPLVGLGTAGSIDEIEIFWPSGEHQVLVGPSVDRTLEVVEPGGGGGR